MDGIKSHHRTVHTKDDEHDGNTAVVTLTTTDDAATLSKVAWCIGQIRLEAV